MLSVIDTYILNLLNRQIKSLNTKDSHYTYSSGTVYLVGCYLSSVAVEFPDQRWVGVEGIRCC